MQNSRVSRTIYASILLVVALVATAYVLVRVTFPLRYSDSIQSAASEFGLQVSLVRAVIWTESKFDPDAVSSAGAVGLMQLMPSTAQMLSIRRGERAPDLTDPDANITYGCCYLAYLLARFGSERTALAAYNAGEGNVSIWLTDDRYSVGGELTHIPFAETRAYVDTVQRVKNIYAFVA